MINLDEDALICDFAEYYHIYDYHQIRPLMCAALAVGLRENSRIRMKLTRQKITTDQTLLAAIADRLGILIWQRTENGQKGVNMPKSIIDEINRDHSMDVRGFDSGESLLKELEKYNVD